MEADMERKRPSEGNSPCGDRRGKDTSGQGKKEPRLGYELGTTEACRSLRSGTHYAGEV